MTRYYYVADAYGNLIDDSEWRQDEPDSDASDEEHHNGDSMKIEKFRELIRSLQDDKPARQGGEEFEMEVTWQPGKECFICRRMITVIIISSYKLYWTKSCKITKT